jgi:hypothetical protein
MSGPGRIREPEGRKYEHQSRRTATPAGYGQPCQDQQKRGEQARLMTRQEITERACSESDRQPADGASRPRGDRGHPWWALSSFSEEKETKGLLFVWVRACRQLLTQNPKSFLVLFSKKEQED